MIAPLIRDDYGHGEVGESPTEQEREWDEKRKNQLERVYFCRILEAQRVLVDWILTQLGGISTA